MLRRLGNPDNGGNGICVVCRELASSDILNDAVICMIAFVQKLALAGGKVTILWIPAGQPNPEEIEKAISLYRDTFSINVALYDRAGENILYLSDASTHLSYGLYTYLKNNDYSVAYIPLEGGLAYYTLLGKETGVYKKGLKINIIASAPLEWALEADRMFFWSPDQLKVNFMEKYSVQEADKLICTSAALRDWMKAKRWKLCSDCDILPALTPSQWNEQPEFGRPAPGKNAREIVLIASPRFRDGMTLFCDVLDRLSNITDGDLMVTIPGSFYQMLGEHTGGMFVRRGRRWKFRLRFLTQLNMRQGLLYAKEVGAVAVIPNFENANGYGVAECIRLGVPFVATAVGGNIEQAEFAGVAGCLAKPNPKDFAALLVEKLIRPDPPVAKKFGDQKFRTWLKALAITKRAGSPQRKKPGGNSPSPLVSVIMTHHDRPQYFLQALESVKEQDYPNFEVIVVDDGSSLPESHAMLDGLKSEFRRRKWKIIKTENRYVGAARNTGVRAARGKFIVFVDDDNALMPGAISTFVSVITHTNSDVCPALSRNFYGRHVPGSNRFNYMGWLPLGASPDICFFENVIGDTCSIYRKTIFDKIGYQFEKFGYMTEDYEFFSRAMLAGLKIRVIPEALFWYRISTQGRYRSSHYYDNQLPILDVFLKAKSKGLDDLYKLVLGQNIPVYAKNMYKMNLSYSPSDSGFLDLCELEPNSREAVSLLAKLAAGESRADTAVGLLASLGVSGIENGLEAILKAGDSSSYPVMAQIPVFTSSKTLGTSDLLAMQVSSELPGNISPKSYVEQPGRLFIESVNGSLSIAVLPAGISAHATSVVSQVSASDAAGVGLEFLLLLLPMYENPVAAVQAAGETRSEANSGWVPVGPGGIPTELTAHFSTPSITQSNLVLALRSRVGQADSVMGCFGPISIRTALEEKVGRPRLGAPPQGLHGKAWTNAERTSATLVTAYPVDLPLLLFPKDIEDGIFLRPSADGPVVAAIHGGFPAFAQRLLAQVEIAHEESSPFEFAVALTVPGADLEWRASGPRNSAAFSGWVRVEERFKLHDISVQLLEKMSEPLTINLAIRLPRGSSATPANAFWRNIKFFWED